MKSDHLVQARTAARAVLGATALLLANGCSSVAGDPPAIGALGEALQATHGHQPHHGDSASGPAAKACTFVDQDRLFRTINADLLSNDARDQRFLRYLSLANRENIVGCGAALDADRAAILELINSVSNDADVHALTAVDADQTLYRLDLRDYTWNHPIVVGGQRFADGWEALIAESPYALEYSGADADIAKASTHTAVPFLFGNAFVAAAGRAPLYDALLGIPGDADDLLRNNLGIDAARGESARAGFAASARRGEANFLAQRFEIRARPGFAWQISEFGDLFSDPLGNADGEREIVFSLPNGLQGHVLAAPDGRLRATSKVLADASEADGRAHVATSFFRSRADGVQIEDQVRDFVRANPRDFSASERDEIRAAYPGQRDLQKLLDGDRKIFSTALGHLGLDIASQPEPISQNFSDFSADLDLNAVAGDLFLTPADLANNVDLLDAAFAGLPNGGKIHRDDFTAKFARANCLFSVVLNNTVRTEVCDRAFQP
ncbi:MAG TPA: hypothetical protein VG963_11145 [Polyangiaceae bacterium]|nr:hypothetical protein [Polyangiaceae bacterium]